MADVFDRVQALPTIAKLWPREPGVGSNFASDATHASISTYTVARVLLLDAMHRLQAAARIAQTPDLARQGTHILLLRPALVSTAKGAWLVQAADTADRVSRATRLVAEDRRQGASAMGKAVEQGAPDVFGAVGRAFERSRDVVLSAVRDLTPEVHRRPPRDESMIADLGSAVDSYYGTNSAMSDVQLLWNTSSSLAHGERWYSTLTAGPRRAPVADILTDRSFDVVCSGLNVTGLRILTLAAARNPN
ncbi:hypothetical protein [Micromonospora sp. DT233]|uniref:hypothetical protein n=1 Tax=Micromonospora sp. DT233 TaxID=3393432 RepID=UPI003CEB8D23